MIYFIKSKQTRIIKKFEFKKGVGIETKSKETRTEIETKSKETRNIIIQACNTL